MLDFLKDAAQFSVPIFVLATMLNVGLTQSPSKIIAYLQDWPFIVKMLLANFLLAPLAMIILMRLFSFDRALEAGLLIFALCAGAPFLIKLTQTSENDMALGAATMMLLMVVTVIYVPIASPRVLTGVSVDAWAIARALALQLLLPIVIGMLAAEYLPDTASTIQPWVAKLGNYALYFVLVTTIVGYFPEMIDIVKTGAIFVGLAFVALSFGFGFLAGGGEDHLEDVGGLGTAQRNTAAGMIIATQNFSDPDVFVMLTLANVLGIMMLLAIARFISRDNPKRQKIVKIVPV